MSFSSKFRKMEIQILCFQVEIKACSKNFTKTLPKLYRYLKINLKNSRLLIEKTTIILK